MNAKSDKLPESIPTNLAPSAQPKEESTVVPMLILLLVVGAILGGTYLTFTRPQYESRRLPMLICYGLIFLVLGVPLLIQAIAKTTIGQHLIGITLIVGMMGLAVWFFFGLSAAMSTAPPWVGGLIVIYFLFGRRRR